MFSIGKLFTVKYNSLPSVLYFSVNCRATTVDENTPSRTKRLKCLYGFGVVATGALGVEEFVIPRTRQPAFAVYTPVRLRYVLENRFDVRTIACGFGFSVFIANNSSKSTSVFGCGLNSDGQLGQQLKRIQGSISSAIQVDLLPKPQPITFNTDDGYQPFAVSCGRTHTLIACKSNNTVGDSRGYSIYSLGNNTFGQCAREIIDGEIFTSENAVATNISLPADLLSVKQLVCGQDHSLVLTDDGIVFSSGLGVDGQTGLGISHCTDRLTRVKGAIENIVIDQLSSRGDTVLALSRCGRLFGWGNNEYGQLWPVIDTVQVLEPIELPFQEYLNVYMNKPTSGDQTLPPGFTVGELRSVASCGSMCAVLDEYGHVFVWGFGCLGLGPETHQATGPHLIPPSLFAPAMPNTEHHICDIVPGLHHFIARSNAGLLWAWGAPRGGVSCLGLGRLCKHSKKAKPLTMERSIFDKKSTVGNVAQTYPSQLSIPAEVVDVFCGVDHTILLCKSFA